MVVFHRFERTWK